MKQITINTYEFKELKKEVKEKVIDDNRLLNVNDNDWWEFDVDDLKERIKTELDLNIENVYFELMSRGNNIHIDSQEVIRELSNKYPKLYNLVIPNKFGLFCNYLGGGLSGGLNGSDFDEEHIVMEEEYSEDESVNKEVEMVMNNKIKHNIMKDLTKLQEMLKNFYIGLNESYDYLMSDESIIETIECNDYRFKECGEMV